MKNALIPEDPLDVGKPTPIPRRKARIRRTAVSSSLRTIVVEADHKKVRNIYKVEWYLGGFTQRRFFKTEEEANHFRDLLEDLHKQARLEVIAANQEMLEMFTVCWRRLGERGMFDMLRKEMTRADSSDLDVGMTYAINKYLKYQTKCGNSDAHIYSLKCILRKFNDNFKTPLREAEPRHFSEYLDKIPHPNTRKQVRTSLRGFLKFAQNSGWLPEGRLAIENTPVPKHKPTTPEIFTPEEMAAMLAACHEKEVLAFLVVGGFCGARTAEIMRLKWEHWRPDTSSLIFPNDVTKTLRRRVCTVEPNAAKWMNKLMGQPGESITQPEIVLRRKLVKACERAGVKWKPNALRHSYASYHLELHSNPQLTAKNCGHQVNVLMQNYMQITDLPTAQRWFAIEPAEQNT